MDEVEPAPAYVAKMILERYQLLDEIERLRKELADWKKVAEYEHAGFCGCCGQDESHLLNTLEVYVRNR